MSLRAKIIYILIGVFILYGSVEYLIQRTIIFPSFLELEQNDARENLKRTINALDREIFHLDLKCSDWAHWDDMYSFVDSHSPSFIRSNLNDDSLVSLGISFMYIYDTKGRVVWGRCLDPETDQRINLRDFSRASLDRHHPLLQVDLSQDKLSVAGLSGIIMTERGPLMVATRPILTSEVKGPAQGYVIFGQFLSKKLLDKLRKQTQVDFSIFSDNRTISMIRANASRPLDADYHYYMIPEASNRLHIFTVYRDILGKPAFVIRTTIPRLIVERGFATMKFALLSILLAGIGVLIIIHLILRSVILIPLSRLTEHALSIGERGDYTARLDLRRSDEIGLLANEFDRMVEKIDVQTKELNNLACMDGLTLIANRRCFNECLQKEWKRMMRERRPLSIILCDVDSFKLFNDSYGHLAGDDCLRTIAQLIQKNTKRPSDFAARYGGEEFGIILPDTDEKGAFYMAECIRTQVRELEIPHGTSPADEFVTLSLGLSTAIPDETLSCEDMVDLADRALYEAKARGRNCTMLRIPVGGSSTEPA